MNVNTKSETFPIDISLIAHVRAETFRCYQSRGIKAKQVYLNTLAVYAVNSYLNLIGWSTNLSQSDSWNPISQTMMNVADLIVPSYGRLECRPVFEGEDTVIIPPEVWTGRIGYVIVMLDRQLKRAEVVGFTRQVDRLELPIYCLESMDKFPTYLSQQKRLEPSLTAELSGWIQGSMSYGWQMLEELFAPSLIVNFRSRSELAQLPTAGESRVKLVELGMNLEHTIALILDITPIDKNEFDVSIIVRNYQYDRYLPEGLELVIVDRQNHPVMIAQANQTETIEFCFSGELQEKFTVEIFLDEQLIVENFTI